MGYALVAILNVAGKRRAGLVVENPVMIAAKLGGIVAASSVITVAICNHSDVQGTHLGLPLPGLIIVIFLALFTFLAKRTTFGQHVYAVGGNAEAARRAGINVPRIRVLVFIISGASAAIGGVILAANINSVGLTFPPATLLNSIAAAVIGGVSLGGRGEVRAAFLGSLVIATVAERPQYGRLFQRHDLHRHRHHPPARSDARHVRAAPASALRALSLRLERALAIVQFVVSEAESPVSVFVTDAHGEIVAAATMDGACADTRLECAAKGVYRGSLGREVDAGACRESGLPGSGRAREASTRSSPFFLGGVAVFDGDHRIGAVGVSGLPWAERSTSSSRCARSSATG